MTDPEHLPAGNRAEIAIRDAKAGAIPMADMLQTLMSSALAVPSGGAVQPDGEGFQPLLFDRAGAKMVACFTDRARVGPVAAKAPYLLELNASEFMRRVPPAYGVVINPGQEIGFEIDSDGVRRIVAEFA